MAAVTAKELMNWLKSYVECPCWTCGRLDLGQEETICVQSGTSPLPSPFCVGGGRRSWQQVKFTILLRWGQNFPRAADKAGEVFAALDGAKGPIAGKMAFLSAEHAEAENLGTDEDGVFRFAVSIMMITER